MKRLRRYLFTLLVAGLVLGLARSSDAQSRRYYELVREFSQPQIDTEALVLPDRDSTALVGVTFRLPHPLLVFHQTGSAAGERGFRANVRVAVEVLRDGEPVRERTWREIYDVAAYESTRDEEAALEGGLWVDLPPGRYTYRFEVVDLNADQTARSSPRALRVPTGAEPAVGPAVFVREVGGGGDRIRVQPANLSGDVAFGASAYAVIPVWADSLAETATIAYELLQGSGGGRGSAERDAESDGLLDFGDDSRGGPAGGAADVFRRSLARDGARSDESGSTADLRPVRSDTLPPGDLIPLSGVHPVDSTSSAFSMERAVSRERAEAYAAVVDLRGERLENATYRLRTALAGSDASAADTARFATYWRAMPYSLYDLDVALEHLSFIVPEDTLDALRSGSRREKRRQFEAFWDRRDPNPRTPFNPLVAEYYRRIDYAADEFRTGLSPTPNGLETDRGRIYVVHGAPEETARSVPERGRVRETWTYEDGRTFVFEASSSLDSFELVTQSG